MGSPWESYRPTNLGNLRQEFGDLSAEVYRDRQADEATRQFDEQQKRLNRESYWNMPENLIVGPEQMAPLSPSNNARQYSDALADRSRIERESAKPGVFQENNGQFYQFVPDPRQPDRFMKQPVRTSSMDQGMSRSPAMNLEGQEGYRSQDQMRQDQAVSRGGSYDPATRQSSIPGNALNMHYLKTMYPAVQENVGNIYASTRPQAAPNIQQDRPPPGAGKATATPKNPMIAVYQNNLAQLQKAKLNPDLAKSIMGIAMSPADIDRQIQEQTLLLMNASAQPKATNQTSSAPKGVISVSQAELEKMIKSGQAKSGTVNGKKVWADKDTRKVINVK